MNTKKIAGLIRRLSSYDLTGLPFTSRCMSEILEELANEIEPQPTEETKPEPAYKVGDWVEYKFDSQIYYGKLSDIRDHAYYLSVTTEDIPPDQARAIRFGNIVRRLNPSEVIDAIDPDTAELVKALIRAQGGEE